TVFLFAGGQPIATFAGALPETGVRDWLRRYLPAPPEKAVPEDPVGRALQEGREGDAKKLLAQKLEKGPDDTTARFLLARVVFAEDIEKAAEIVVAIPEDSEAHDTALQFLRLRDLVRWAKGKDATRTVQGPDADVALYREGIRDMENGEPHAAL